jgi:hypothetical protein
MFFEALLMTTNVVPRDVEQRAVPTMKASSAPADESVGSANYNLRSVIEGMEGLKIRSRAIPKPKPAYSNAKENAMGVITPIKAAMALSNRFWVRRSSRIARPPGKNGC